MTFQIHPLPSAQFAEFFDMSSEDLTARSARLVTAKETPGYPCRVSLEDAAVGETVLLTSYTHLPVASPYQSSHAIYVREGVAASMPEPGEVPDVIASRLISIRAFDDEFMMRAADVVEGRDVGQLIQKMFADPAVHTIHLHNARQGCFAARVTRAGEM